MLKNTLALFLVVILLYVAACDTKDPILCGDDQRKSRYMPSMTAHREALLLFLPLVEEMPDTVHVEVRMNDELVDTRLLTHPNDLLAADIPTACNVRYSNAAWSLRLSYDLMREELSLHFIVDRDAEDEQQGTLPVHALEFSPASSLVFRTARLGMLTHVDETARHFTLNDPILAATDYFQTLPVSKLVMASYANIELDRVMVQSGVIYDQ